MTIDQDLSYWDTQFRFSAILPDFSDRLAAAADQSAKVSPSLNLKRLNYGPNERQFVEIAEGDSENGKLLPVFIHGGYWRALSAQDHRFLLPAFMTRSGRSGNVEYRLMPTCRMADLVDDIACALDVLTTTFQRPLLLIGHSAGAHLALAAASQQANRETIGGLVLISGIYDLEPVRWSFLQEEIALTADEVRRWSLTSPACAITSPAVFAVGGSETHEFRRQSEMMSRRHDCPLVVIPAENHMSILWSLADRQGALYRLIDQILAEGRMHDLSGSDR